MLGRHYSTRDLEAWTHSPTRLNSWRKTFLNSVSSPTYLFIYKTLSLVNKFSPGLGSGDTKVKGPRRTVFLSSGS